MSEISIKFRLTDGDIQKYNKTATGKVGGIINIIFCTFIGYFIVKNIMSDEKSWVIIVTFSALFLFFLLRPLISGRNVKKLYKNSFILRTDTVVDFYNDHIVEKNEGGETGIRYEEHFPLEAIKSVIETNEYFTFFISPLEAIIIPKRALSEEHTVKLNNLIQNVFPGRFEKRS